MGKTFRLRLILIALVFVALTAGGIATVFAFEDELTLSALAYGSGTEEDPYRLYNSTQLLNLQEIADSRKSEEYTAGKFFKLCADVAVTRVPKISGGFYGAFDGDGHTLTVKNYGLFYELKSGATLKNLNVNIDIENGYDKYAVCYRVCENAVIEYCNVRGNIDIDFTPLIGKTPNAATVTFGVFSVHNAGVIKCCSYTGNISAPGGVTVGALDLAVFSFSNSGVIENCTVDCDMDIKMTFIGRLTVQGVASDAVDCTYNGNISVVYENKSNTYRYCRITVYGLGRVAHNCVYNGDIYLDMSYGDESRKTAVAASEGEFAHNGELIY